MVSSAATNPEIGTAAEHISVQFYAPTIAARLLDPHVIWPRAKAAGILRYQWESSRTRAFAGQTVITARRTLVPFLIEYWVELAKTGKHDPEPIARAVKAAFEELERPWEQPRGFSTDGEH